MAVQVQTTKQISPLRKAFGLFGGLRLKLDETVVPVAIVEDLVRDEWRFAFAGDDRGAAGAGNHHIWQLENPDGSGKIAEVYEISFGCGAAQSWVITVTNTPYIPGTVLEPQWQDLDGLYVVPNSFPSTRQRWTASNAAITGTVIFAMTTPAIVPTFYRPTVTLHPGQEITLWQIGDNLDGTANFQWRERPLGPTER